MVIWGSQIVVALDNVCTSWCNNCLIFDWPRAHESKIMSVNRGNYNVNIGRFTLNTGKYKVNTGKYKVNTDK